MNKNGNLWTAMALMASLGIGMVACEKKTASVGTPRPAPSATPLPANLFLTAAPAEAKEVKDIKPTVKAGDQVVIHGRIGGSKDPFVAGRAMFTLVDTHLKACGEEDPADSCKTPWDFCCEPKEVMTANTATVQVVGPEGAPLKTDLKDAHGLKPLSKVTVVGKVASIEGGSLVVNAQGLWVE